MKLADKLLSLMDCVIKEANNNLTDEQIKIISKAAIEYASDWPEELFSVEANGSVSFDKEGDETDSSLDSLDVKIIDVKDFVEMMASDNDIEIDFKSISDTQLAKIFNRFEGNWYSLDTKISASQVVRYGRSEDDSDYDSFEQKVTVRFKVKNLKYMKNKDMIEVSVSNEEIESVG